MHFSHHDSWYLIVIVKKAWQERSGSDLSITIKVTLRLCSLVAVDSALLSSGVAKTSTSFAGVKAGISSLPGGR